MERILFGLLLLLATPAAAAAGGAGARAAEDSPALYTRFAPGPGREVASKELVVDHSFGVGGLTVVSGYYDQTRERPVYDTEEDYGRRLLCFGSGEGPVYTSHGVGEVYLYKPVFFRSPQGDGVLILCQLAYEYFFGADVYLLSGGGIDYMGRLSVESADVEDDSALTDFVVIEQKGDAVEFLFPVERLVLDPGSECIEIDNDGYKYILSSGELIWTGPPF